jgi:hypothetical protein
MNRFIFILFLVSSTRAFWNSHKRAVPSSTVWASKERKPWDVFRFVSQSSKFVPTPFSSKASKQLVKPNDLLWKASSPTFTFAPLDDVVMGGASSSTFANGVWKGTVTDANNGGFIGIRNTPNFDWDLSSCRGLELTLRRRTGPSVSRFKVGIRDSMDFNGLVWAASFDLPTTNNPKKIRVPFDKLTPTKFAAVVTGVELNRSNVVGIQLIYSKFEYGGELNPKFAIGDVDLEILEIRAY